MQWIQKENVIEQCTEAMSMTFKIEYTHSHLKAAGTTTVHFKTIRQTTIFYMATISKKNLFCIYIKYMLQKKYRERKIYSD